MYDQEKVDIIVELNRLRKIAKEVVGVIRTDGNLFAKLSRRTKRWIKTQDKLERERTDANDAVIRLGKLRQAALSKLTRKEQEILGVANSDADEDIE